MFTFKHVFRGNSLFNALFTTSLTTQREAVKSAVGLKSNNEKPIEGTSSIAPSTAADIVPEYNTLLALFSPWLIPETSKSGLRCITSEIANFTQSTGVPVHEKAVMPLYNGEGSNLNTLFTVIACPIPD